MEYNYRDFMKWYRGFCWACALSWPLYATLNLWYITTLHRLKNPLSLLIKLRYLLLVTFIVAFLSVFIIVIYAAGLLLGTVWSSTEIMRTVTAHCCRNGHRFDLGYQRQFQCYMNHKGVGFQKM